MKWVIILSTLLITGCASEPTMWDLNSQDRIEPTVYVSPMDNALYCAKHNAKKNDIRLGIGVIRAEDGVFDYEGQGNYTPSSAHHMKITSLMASGFRVINRLGEVTAMMEWENQKAMDKLLGDARSNYVRDQRPVVDYDGEPVTNKMGEQMYEPYNREIKYRILNHGQILGSTHLLSGAITRLDFDTSSGGFELYYDGVGIGRRVYRMLVGIDLHVTDTITGEVVWAEGYDKQYFGIETKAGAFRMVDDNLVDLNAGAETNEPIQTGIHYMMDFIAYDLSRYFLGVDSCDSELPNSVLESGGSGDSQQQQLENKS